MISLYHCERARSLRVVWTLEEAGLPYQLYSMRFPPRVHSPHFLQENPIGTVPLMIDGSVRMTESAAICEYLVARYGVPHLASQPQDPDFGEWLEWLHYGEATLTYPLAIALRWGRMAPPAEQLPQVVEDRLNKFLDRLKPVEACISRREWLLSKGFTVADVSVCYALYLAQLLDLTPRLPTAVQDYLQRAQAREGFQRALSAWHGEPVARDPSSTTVAAK